MSGDLVDLEVIDPGQVEEAARKLASITDPSTEIEVDERHVRGRVPRAGRAVQSLLRDLDRSGIDLDSIEVARPTLDDVFFTLTGRSLRDAESESAATDGPPDGSSDEPPDEPPDSTGGAAGSAPTREGAFQ